MKSVKKIKKTPPPALQNQSKVFGMVLHIGVVIRLFSEAVCIGLFAAVLAAGLTPCI